MRAYYLALIGGQIFAIEKERVAGVGVRDENKLKPKEDNGRKFIPLGNADMALVCDLLPHIAGKHGKISATHYLIISHQGLFMALPMLGRGRLVMADETAIQPLPPAFAGIARKLVPGIVINCMDIIMMVDLDILAEVSDSMDSMSADMADQAR